MGTTKFYFRTLEEAEAMSKRTWRNVVEIGEETRPNGETWYWVKVESF